MFLDVLTFELLTAVTSNLSIDLGKKISIYSIFFCKYNYTAMEEFIGPLRIFIENLSQHSSTHAENSKILSNSK